MKYTIEISPVFYFEGAKVEVEATEEECVSSLKCVEKIYAELGKMFMQSMMPTSCQPTCTYTASTSEEKPATSTSFKEVEKEEKPVAKKAKKEKEKDDEDEYI